MGQKQKDDGAIHLLAILLIILIIGLVVVVFSKINQDTATKPRTAGPNTANSQERLRGFSLSPKDSSAASFSGFFDQLPKKNAALTWSGDWIQLEDPKAAPHVVATLAKQKNYEPIIIVSAFKGGDGFDDVSRLRPLDDTTIKRYVDSAKDFCSEYSPAYFGVGVEINRIYASSTTDFENFVSLFNQTASSLDSACPSTKIFTTFQLEHLRGLRGGLFGGNNNESNNDWQLLERFDKADILAFTTYPVIVFRDPNDIPDDYYNTITNQTKKPVAFSEVGWSTQINISGWETSEDEQKRFVEKFLDSTSSLNSAFNIWSFLYDQDLPDPFHGIGLLQSNDQPRAGYSLWVNQ